MAKMKKRSDGNYQKSVVIGTSPNGTEKRKIVYARTIAELEKKVDEIKNLTAMGLVLGQETFSEVAKLWWDYYVPTKLKPEELHKKRHFEQMRDYINFILIPQFGNRPVRELSKFDLQSVINFLDQEKDYATSTMEKVKIAANKVMSIAEDKRLILANPFRSVRIPRKKAVERRMLDDFEIDLITEFYYGHRMGIPALIALYCGLRRGEIMALDWNEDVDLSNKRIYVRRALAYNDNRPIVKSPKSEAGYRWTPIPDFLIDILKHAPKKTSLVCPSVRGNLMTKCAYRRAWDSYIEYLNVVAGGRRAVGTLEKKTVINRFTAHNLRHTYCSILYDADVDIKTAQRYMGHSDVHTTLEIYTHLTDYKEEVANQTINEHLNKKNEKRSDRLAEAISVYKNSIA